jgi:hypothetical protein
MSNEQEKGGLPAPAVHLPAHAGGGFTINLAGIPIPLRRTFAAIDRLFAIPIEALGDAWEKKIKGNLDSHVETVQKSRKKRGKKEKIDDPSLKLTRTMSDWAFNAADVGPEDKDMSALWQAILDAIMDDEDEGEQLLRIVKEAKRSDVRLFLRRFGVVEGLSVGTEPGGMERLRYAGLVEHVFGSNFIILFGAMCVAALYFIVRYAPKIIIGEPPLSNFSMIWVWLSNLAVPMGATITIMLFFVYQLKTPTRLGKRLLELYREYKKDEK